MSEQKRRKPKGLCAGCKKRDAVRGAGYCRRCKVKASALVSENHLLKARLADAEIRLAVYASGK